MSLVRDENKKQELREWNTEEALAWIMNDEEIYRSAMNVKSKSYLKTMWRHYKQGNRDIDVDSRYINWDVLFREIKEQQEEEKV